MTPESQIYERTMGTVLIVWRMYGTMGTVLMRHEQWGRLNRAREIEVMSALDIF
ncbi:hypothetical protein [Petroclostridium xylanilyticum]|uniref:hypothetical protein n=1 Tax=Petroclostridium xylanilyticum TaxID=1792311 RepID=UPI0018E2C2C6|nr:hypothetical protein [Petroclostridium xylanilyticum]